MKSIENGKLDATIAQQPDEMGKKAVKTVKDLKDDKAVKKEIKIPLKLEEQK